MTGEWCASPERGGVDVQHGGHALHRGQVDLVLDDLAAADPGGQLGHGGGNGLGDGGHPGTLQVFRD